MFFFLINTTFTMKTFSYYFRTCKNLSSLAALLSLLLCLASTSLFLALFYGLKKCMRETRSNFFFSTMPGGTILTLVATEGGFFSESVILFSNLQISKKNIPKKLSWAWNLNFKFRIVFWNISFWRFGDVKNESQFLKKSHL